MDIPTKVSSKYVGVLFVYFVLVLKFASEMLLNKLKDRVGGYYWTSQAKMLQGDIHLFPQSVLIANIHDSQRYTSIHSNLYLLERKTLRKQ